MIATFVIMASEVLRVVDLDEHLKNHDRKLTMGLDAENFVLLFGIAMKSISMVPFVTYEYYLLLFNHLFVDASHYMGAASSHTFLV